MTNTMNDGQTEDMDIEIVLKALDRLARHCRAASRLLVTLDEKLVPHRALKVVEVARMELRKQAFALEDAEKLANSCSRNHETVERVDGVTASCERCGAVLG